jgi:hypothetical protein
MLDVEHAYSLFIALRQKRPVVGVQTTAPQMHSSLLAVLPSVSEQTETLAQRLAEDIQ